MINFAGASATFSVSAYGSTTFGYNSADFPARLSPNRYVPAFVRDYPYPLLRSSVVEFGCGPPALRKSASSADFFPPLESNAANISQSRPQFFPNVAAPTSCYVCATLGNAENPENIGLLRLGAIFSLVGGGEVPSSSIATPPRQPFSLCALRISFPPSHDLMLSRSHALASWDGLGRVGTACGTG